MSNKTILVWFRNDLRLHDNEILYQAMHRAGQVVPVYCFDPRHYTETAFSTKKTGIHRARFILESVLNLKKNLQLHGGDLLTITGYPEVVIPEIAAACQVDEVYHHREVAEEETHISTLVEEALWKQRLNLRHFIGHTLYHKEDLPFPIRDIPDDFSRFRKRTERESSIRPDLPLTEKIVVPASLNNTLIPTLNELGFDDEYTSIHPGGILPSYFKGGEEEGLTRMQTFLTDNEMISPLMGNSSGILSPWLALGCLSAHTVYHAVKAAEADGLARSKAQGFMLGLWWRDYYRFMFKKHGNRFFRQEGFTGEAPRATGNQESFEQWKTGRTGYDMVDAGIRQLNQTGFIPYPIRLICASYLIHHLHINWLWGASYFEEMLIDYAPASNYGSWAHAAGVGSSLRDNKPADIKRLATDFDPQGTYTEHWLQASLSKEQIL